MKFHIAQRAIGLKCLELGMEKGFEIVPEREESIAGTEVATR